MSLSLAERETIINFNRGDRKVYVYSCDPIVVKSLARQIENRDCVQVEKKSDEVIDFSFEYGCASVAITKSGVKLYSRVLTEEQRKALSDRMKKVRKANGKA